MATQSMMRSGNNNATAVPSSDRSASQLIRICIALLLALSLALGGCTGASGESDSAQPRETPPATSAQALPGTQPQADVEELAKQAFEPQPDGFEVGAEGIPASAEENDNEPSFTEEDTVYAENNPGYESYSELDSLGRCGPAVACLGPETMPADGEDRESISSVKPTGWNQAFYDTVDGEALWNRCHLIAWSLASENANERNLITGTREMNVEAMLPYEEKVARYIEETGNHVLYRATPVFEGYELVCRGVLLEAESLEDDGSGVSFSVFCFNMQAGIAIDYDTGESHTIDAANGREASAAQEADEQARAYVLNISSKRFHLPDCSSVESIKPANRQEATETRSSLIEQGYQPCGNCQP